MSRRRVLGSAMVAAAVLLASCGDDGGADVATGTEPAGSEATGSSASSEPDATVVEPAATTCTDLDVVVLEQVEDPGPEDTRSEDAGPTPEEVQQAEEAAAASGRVADAGPDELRADAATVAAVFATAYDDPEGLTDEDEAAFDEARQRLLTWGVEHCEVDGPIWACAERGTFRTGGGRIDVEDSGAPPVGNPADVVGGVDVEPGWEVVEVERTDDRVTFAWLGADGLALRSETAEAWNGQWTSDQVTSCEVGVDLAPDDQVGEDRSPEELPPPLSSSVPSE